MSKKYDALLKEYRKLAKRADQRLVRLEQAQAKRPEFKNILAYGYANAKRDALSWGASKDRPRFNIAPPKNTNQLKAKIADIQRFLGYETSTISGIRKTYAKRAKTINEKYGTDFTWDSLAEFFESNLYKKMDALYYADAIFESVGQIQANEASIKKALKEHKPIHIKTDDMIVEDTVNHILRYYKKDIKDLFEG